MVQDDDSEPHPLLEEILQKLQNFDLDRIIHNKIRSKSFRPIVHAEVLVHHHLLDQGISHPARYWNQWKYIGSSKATCRLCSHYFSAHQDRVDVRPGHRNLYPCWRLPDVYQDQGDDAASRRLDLLLKLTEDVKNDARWTIEHKILVGKKYDTNTYSANPEYLMYNSGDEDAMSDSELDSGTSQSSGLDECVSVLPPEARHSKSVDVRDEDSCDEDGGVPLWDTKESPSWSLTNPPALLRVHV